MISLDDLTIGFRGPALLDGVSARIERGQRIGLLGRNGAGKTTLLKMLSGDVTPDNGQVILDPNVRLARLTQDVPQNVKGTVQDIMTLPAEEFSKMGTTAGLGTALGPTDHGTWEPWEIEQKIEETLSRMNLNPSTAFESLSSGMRRRVLLARAIASEPDMLLLDEPTNHLDIQSIIWLEDFLSRWSGTLMFITHDRSFLQSLANRIWEIDRGRLFDWTCDYQTFLQRKAAALDAEEKQNALFDKRLAEEEVWIRQGIKARRTRNEGRVRALKAMRNEANQRRSVEGKAKLNLQVAERGGALVTKLDDVSFTYPGTDRVIIRDFTSLIMRGDKIGIIGPNGAGKSTLLKLILGKLEPTSGSVRLGTNLKIAYFDQLRDTLDPELTVQENVGEGSDKIQVGNATKHIMGYLQDYLFTPERARTQVKFLSGGERNRALLAKLMTQPANVIVLDEPTNDLDAETLELLEEQLVGFDGTLLMVSHDRTFLNNVVTSTLVFDDDSDPGIVNEYVGGYDEWEAVAKRRRAESGAGKASGKKATSNPDAKKSAAAKPAAKAVKLSYNDQRELKLLPGKIEKLEAEIAAIHEEMAAPEFYQSGGDVIAQKSEELKAKEEELAQAYERWEALEGH
ncbi:MULTISPECIES: ATP-binding cassette domain-containing protein [Rhodopirellula]|uniref:ATP-binding cassette domain-containing protein n=1 Tax=Rhodopirellula TaxID=265488 RepID=UPI0025795FFE|nr:ATP-binding cassette domain-containing protein [Rhodopirellula sp. UBA1907]|tara:strand:- start:26695 stop:28572 length:1878 start_codon:yes stop_codon:yes gene_type:complete